MFGAIAPRYDLLNHLLSLNRDKQWRHDAVDRLLENAPGNGRFFDACAGTLDLSVEITTRGSFRGTVIASDFTFPMLAAGASKIGSHAIRSVCADSLQLPFPDASFDGAIVGFGVRNLASIDHGLQELARVVRAGGRLVVLEFTTPARQPLRGLYLFYFRRLLPLIGRAVSGHSSAYTYLPESVLQFPEPAALANRIEEAGFGRVSWQTRTGGIVAIHAAMRR